MATASVSITAVTSPAVTLSNPVSLDELQLLGVPTVNIPSTTEIRNVMGTSYGRLEVVEAEGTAAQNGAALLAAYTRLAAINLTSVQRGTIVLMPGVYQLAQKLVVNKNFLNFIGFGGVKDSVIVYALGQDDIGIEQRSDFNIFCNIDFYWGAQYFDCDGNQTTGTEFLNCQLAFPAGAVAKQTFHQCLFPVQGYDSNPVTFSGVLDGCRMGIDDGEVYLGSGAVVRYSVIAPPLNAANPSTGAKVFMSSLSTALGANINNQISSPLLVIDSGIDDELIPPGGPDAF
jgi:hypothetical protein